MTQSIVKIVSSISGSMQKYRSTILIGSLVFAAFNTIDFILKQDAYGQFKVPASANTITYGHEDLELLAHEMNCLYESEIVSASMKPELMIGEKVIVDHCFDFYSVEEGDIIVFKPDNHELVAWQGIEQTSIFGPEDYLIMHRVVEVTDFEDDSRRLVAQGDNNDYIIEGAEDDIDKDEFFGKVIREVA